MFGKASSIRSISPFSKGIKRKGLSEKVSKISCPDSKSKFIDKLVSERAYNIWQDSGCPDGKAEEHWHRAKHEVLSELP